MIIAGIIVAWFVMGYSGSLLTLWFAFAKDGLDVRRSDLLGIGVVMAFFGPVSLIVGLLYTIAFGAKQIPRGDDPIIWRGR